MDFKAANCATYHDIVRYCHEKGRKRHVQPWLGKSTHAASNSCATRSSNGLGGQLSDGFVRTPNGPVIIDVEDIASLPMQSLWHGMNAHPWQGRRLAWTAGFSFCAL